MYASIMKRNLAQKSLTFLLFAVFLSTTLVAGVQKPEPQLLTEDLPEQLTAEGGEQAADKHSGKTLVTLVSYHHSRIVNSLSPGEYSQLGSTMGSMSKALLPVTATKAERMVYEKKIVTSEVLSSDSARAMIEISTTIPMFRFIGVGFPHVETNVRRGYSRYKTFKKLIKIETRADGSIHGVPNIRCSGYSPERTRRRARQYEPTIKKFAARYKIDVHLVKAVIAQESCFRNHVVSPAGATGLMQLMPATAKWLGATNYHNSTENLKTGIRYLAQLKKRFSTDELALAAYNAGPGNVVRYKGIPPFSETLKYVDKVLFNYQAYAMTSRYNVGEFR